MSYPSTLACLVIGFLVVAFLGANFLRQPAQVFCLTDRGHCAPAGDFNFVALDAQR